MGPPSGGRSSSNSLATSASISARMSRVCGCVSPALSAPRVRGLSFWVIGSALVAQVDSVLLDQIGIALLVGLQLCQHLVTRLLHRRQAVLLVERLVLLGL